MYPSQIFTHKNSLQIQRTENNREIDAIYLCIKYEYNSMGQNPSGVNASMVDPRWRNDNVEFLIISPSTNGIISVILIWKMRCFTQEQKIFTIFIYLSIAQRVSFQFIIIAITQIEIFLMNDETFSSDRFTSR
jgi:hypothetical protein